MRIYLLALYLYVIVSVNFLAQFFYAFMVKNYSSKVGGTQLQNKSISGTQQEKDWEPLIYTNKKRLRLKKSRSFKLKKKNNSTVGYRFKISNLGGKTVVFYLGMSYF